MTRQMLIKIKSFWEDKKTLNDSWHRCNAFQKLLEDVTSEDVVELLDVLKAGIDDLGIEFPDLYLALNLIEDIYNNYNLSNVYICSKCNIDKIDENCNECKIGLGK